MSRKLDDYGSMLKASFIDQVSTLPLLLGAALTIKFFKQSYLDQRKTEQLLKENLYAELQLLKAQIHPHFLFNTINNIFFHTLTLSTQAPDLLRKLSDIMKYFLTECNQPVVSLKKELDSLEDYLTLEKIRYGDNLHLELSLPDDPGDLYIAPMLLIPFIENSFKHGASLSLDRSVISLQVEIRDCWLIYNLHNDIHDNPGVSRTKGNIGLNNVRKRLELLYTDAYVLNITATSEEYHVELKINLQKLKLPERDTDVRKQEMHAMA
jgi:LytS/YehU family sensor histidine kinase